MGESRYGQWEPCDMRVSRTVLRGALGETPGVYSLLNHLGRCAFVESQRASEAGFAIDSLII
jgi:hypothetical protein